MPPILNRRELRLASVPQQIASVLSSRIPVALRPLQPIRFQVGPRKQYATPCTVIAAAGDTIQIDSSGNYAGDACAWSTNNLHIVGVGSGRLVIDANGQS